MSVLCGVPLSIDKYTLHIYYILNEGLPELIVIDIDKWLAVVSTHEVVG